MTTATLIALQSSARVDLFDHPFISVMAFLALTAGSLSARSCLGIIQGLRGSGAAYPDTAGVGGATEFGVGEERFGDGEWFG